MGLLLYNALMAVQLVAVLVLQRYSRRPAPVRSTLGFIMAALGLGSLIGLGIGLYPSSYNHSTFAMMNLWVYGLFGHVPVLLLGQAWLLARRRAKIRAVLAVVGAVSLWAIALDALVIEPRALQMTRVVIRSPKVDRPYRIAVLADIQTDQPGDFEREVIRRTLEEKPDLILLPGDYLQADDPAAYVEARKALNGVLRASELRAPLGVHAVPGNVEQGSEWIPIFDGTDVVVYPETATAAVGGLSLTALDLDDSFRTDIDVAAQPGFHIAFGHGPDFALGSVRADLMVAGHTHGGQVQLPGIGPLVTFSRVPRAWADGVTRLPDGRTLVVSRGIGMERMFAPRLRFLCRPEVVIIELKPE